MSDRDQSLLIAFRTRWTTRWTQEKKRWDRRIDTVTQSEGFANLVVVVLPLLLLIALLALFVAGFERLIRIRRSGS